ncbi:Serine/threonine-protein kinase ATM [Acorus calamus]|uniref:Serine/threonine-protein kinase ATM n=1 Tax=Acorus calamus TaxID=4465 RepID=A0AAV9F489_ACOCL|nr:Serine/threonine-protein kinase ATM [Acorus calamus]
MIRLCQDIVLLKAEVAELLFPNVLVDIAMGKDSKVDICQKISEKVMEYVLFDSNDMIKSVKTMLNALNELRLFHVLERVGASSVQSSQEISKKARTSSYSRMRSTSERYKDQSSPTNVGRMSCILWTKVYWFCIDYLVVAKAAIRCGLYFTAVLYVEHWCEEHFNGLTLGESDFSLHEELPAHIELLVAAITRINEPDSIYGIIQSHKYEAAWRAGNWDFSLLPLESNYIQTRQITKRIHFNESVHSCLRALQEGDPNEFHMKINDSKKELVVAISRSSMESAENIYSTIVKLQMDVLIADWSFILKQARLHLNLLEPFIAFRRVLLQILNCNECTAQHLLQSASTFRKGSRFSQAAAAVHEFKLLNAVTGQEATSYSNSLGRLEEAKILWVQGQHDMAINLARYILQNYQLDEDASNVYRLVGKWLAENRSSNSRTILEQYLKQSVKLAELNKNTNENSISRQCQMYFHLAHYTDALFRSYEERLASSEWQAAMRLRKHKGEKNDYSIKIQELQKQLTMDREEAKKLQDDRDSFLSLSLEGYQRCLVLGDKYDLRVVFRLLSLWFSLSSRQSVVESMLNAVKEVQSYKFVPLVYQIASRMGGPKDGQGSNNFQHALVSLVKKMACDHPYHTIFQILALANGHRVKDKQRSRSSFIVDMDKKHAAENLLNELSSYHGDIIRQMKHMVEIYIKLAELEAKKEDTNKKVALPRELRSAGQLELVPVVTATFPIDRSCRYHEGTFPHFKGLVMNGINAPKVVECLGSDGQKYRQLAKSGNDDLRQDAVMEQFFGLVNTFLLNHRDTWKRRIGIRTYKVVPFTPSAGVLEWVDRTVPLGEYLLGSTRNGGAHGRYGIGDWSFLRCREYMVNVGYIVGLGDRHSMNILIDETTAEVVHIDLGVAFEQGLMLKTPERVPFRLTRDVINGMGVTGVEGVFRRCCEKTLSVMRTNKEALITIIEVFIHDPLYKWALSPLKALQRQKEIDDDMEFSLEDSQDEWEGNKDATRALLRVKQKLDGYDDGEMRSVQGQLYPSNEDGYVDSYYDFVFAGVIDL